MNPKDKFFKIGIYVKLIISQSLNDCEIIKNANEWKLSRMFKAAFRDEDFKTCGNIKNEIDIRIENGTINHNLMNGFRYYDPKKEMFTGDYDFSGLNGLFDNYKPLKDENNSKPMD